MMSMMMSMMMLVMSMMVSFVLSFFPRDVLDEILNLIESVSEDFPSYFNNPNWFWPFRKSVPNSNWDGCFSI